MVLMTPCPHDKVTYIQRLRTGPRCKPTAFLLPGPGEDGGGDGGPQRPRGAEEQRAEDHHHRCRLDGDFAPTSAPDTPTPGHALAPAAAPAPFLHRVFQYAGRRRRGVRNEGMKKGTEGVWGGHGGGMGRMTIQLK